jgi:hypothetical protein
MTTKPETHRQARERLWDEVKAAGWEMSDPHLKTPHATFPGLCADRPRLWFKPQSVWVSRGLPATLGRARSLWLDPRETTGQQLIDEVVQ